MSRYYMSVLRKFRTLQSRLPGMGKLCKYSKKPRYPGQHGAKFYRKKTFYKVGLVEKQRLRYNYGLTDNKLKFYVKQAKVIKGYSNQVLLTILDRRVDSIIFHARITKSIQSARQIIAHRNVKVNYQILSSPSYICFPDDLIMIRLSYVLNLSVQSANFSFRILKFLIKDFFLFLISIVFCVGIYIVLLLFVGINFSRIKRRVKRAWAERIKIRSPNVNLDKVIEFYSRTV